MPEPYSHPVAQLLEYGECEVNEWPDYLALGFTKDHVPELIRMALDPDLNDADGDSPEVWATVHAWRTLGQLRAVEAAEPLIELLQRIDEYDDDWLGEELPVVYGMIGPAAIPDLARYLADESHGLYARAAAICSLERIARGEPSARETCISHLVDALKRHAVNDSVFNGFIVAYLMDLKAVEALDVMREAFEQEHVECVIAGDLEDVEIALGVRAERSTPASYGWIHDDSEEDEIGPEWPTGPLSPYVNPYPKPGRNDPCPCGSGKKYKKCCLNKPKPAAQTAPEPEPVRLDLTGEQQAEVMTLVRQGRKIEAIQRVLHLSGAGLKSAKDFVDQLEETIKA